MRAIISIHALVKRATTDIQENGWKGGISIHALVKRATLTAGDVPDEINISIHALVKRATHSHLITFRDSLFQSTPS